MKEIWFSLLSIIYIVSLAVTDGLFNRLVFRQARKLPYKSTKKREIYNYVEWRWVGVIFLVILPVILPMTVSFLFGGWKYLMIYLFWLLVIQWDVIFGKLVFDDWLGDSPSISLPHVGWITLPLKLVIVVRLIVAIAVGGILFKLQYLY
jgi:hypothetical protein